MFKGLFMGDAARGIAGMTMCESPTAKLIIPHLTGPNIGPGDRGFEPVTYVHRGPQENGYWIPEEWVTPTESAKQKIIEEQADKIREAMRRLQEFFPFAGDKGIIGLAQLAIDRVKDLQRQVSDRDRYGRVISEIRSKCFGALYPDAAERPEVKAIEDVATTTQLVDSLIVLAKTSAAALAEKRRDRIADSERMGAEMSARRKFAAGVLHALYPGQVMTAEIPGDTLSIVEDRLLKDLGEFVIAKQSGAAAVEEVKATLDELKSTGHKHEGRSLSHLVDIAIDTERVRHQKSISRIAIALKQDWSTKALPSGNYEDWVSFLVNIITDFWQPKPVELDMSTLTDRAAKRTDAPTVTDRRLAELERRVDFLETKGNTVISTARRG